jgi:hypothetical protein
MPLIPRYDGTTGERIADLNVDQALKKSIDDLVVIYPTSRLNPWLHLIVTIDGVVTNAYVKREGGVYTEIWVYP